MVIIVKFCWEVKLDKDWEVFMGFINKEVFLVRVVWFKEVGVEVRLLWSGDVGGEEIERRRECR